MLPLENNDLELSVDDLLDLPELGQVLSTSLPVSTTASNTVNNDISAGSFGVERNQANDEMTSKLDSEGMEVDAEEKTAAEQKQEEEDEHLAHEMPDSILSSSTQAYAGEVIAPQVKPQRPFSSKKSLLSTGRHVKTLNAVEFDELCLKLSARTAMFGNCKRQKEQVRQQKLQIKELEAELAHLKESEAVLMMTEQRTIESLRAELKMHKKEVAELSVKLSVAAKKEVGVMDILRHELGK